MAEVESSQANAWVYGSEGGWSWRLHCGNAEACDWKPSLAAPKPILEELEAIRGALSAGALLFPGAPLRIFTRSPRIAQLCRGEALSPDPEVRCALNGIVGRSGTSVESVSVEEVSRGAAPDRCRCGETAWRYGPEGTPWCRAHLPPCPCGGGCPWCRGEAAG